MGHRHSVLGLLLVCCLLGPVPLLSASGCQSQAVGAAAAAASATPVVDSVATPSPVAMPEASPSGAALDTVVPATTPLEPTPTALPTTTILLTLWTIEAVSPQADGEAGEVFANDMRAFEGRYPNASVSVELKNESGKGSVLDYLRTASQVAPSVLPDLVVLDTAELVLAARAGTLVALDGRVEAALVNDLLAAARAAGTVDGHLMGIPFEAEVEHLVFNSNKVAQAPLTWTDVLSSNTTYRFPAKGRNGLVNDAFLIQYYALGGKLLDEDGSPFLDEQALVLVLGYYRQGVVTGVVPLDVLDAATADDLWPDYVAANTGIVHVSSSRFLRDRGVLRSSQYADIPTRDGKPLTLGRGRAMAVTSRDPAQQAMAVRLIEWMLQPDNAATWNQITASVPTRYATFQHMSDDPYWQFLQHEMEMAVPAPAFSQYDQISRVLQQAVVEVISGEATPQDAAAAAVNAISR